MEQGQRSLPRRAERQRVGREHRRTTPLESLAEVPAERADPVRILAEQEAQRVPDLISLRRERMTADPFAFLRGSAAVMAADLARTPDSGITVQLCGDAHLANFGMFASPERRLMFDLNDFDETHPGPFEWDVKRLAASAAVAALGNGATRKEARRCARASAHAYRVTMAALLGVPTLDVWFLQFGLDDMGAVLGRSTLRKTVELAGDRSRRRTGASAVRKLTERRGAGRRFREDPPLLVRAPADQQQAVMDEAGTILDRYLATLPPDRVELLERFALVDVAHKVVGVGSVGTLAAVMLLETGDGEPLILQAKQATASVLEPHTSPSRFANSGERVVVGQRLMQASGDPFLGWSRSTTDPAYDFYVRQLRDMKGSIDAVGLSAKALADYVAICGGVLARAHARAGDPAEISGYLGDSDRFDKAVAHFAMSYAGITDEDLGALRHASP